MYAFEKLGLFYIGKKLALDKRQISDTYLLYDSKDLSTHAVCVGMTGSGKTGLCIGLIEESAIDKIPSIIIDPKGDMGNLLLTFPELKGQDFLPWINQDEAQKKELSLQAYADQQAELWRKGLAQWDQGSERISLLRDSCDFAIYTPGSNAGLPVSIVNSFAAPSGQMVQDMDMLRERIQTTVSGLLELLGIATDPIQSREHILVSNIIEQCWISGQDLTLGDLIRMIQSPPIEQIGVFNIEDFYPAKERIKLAMSLNNLLAAPAFKAWMEGEALDIGQMIYTAKGKPRSIIFSVAHLSDAERMFFVTLLLNQVLGWMRTQRGSTSLKAILYMDEVFGFLPPVSEPPSKRPLLTLLKQARAFGLGVVLATQNPVDLDYKALSNAGTWFIGRLQTEKDKERLAEGLSRGSLSDKIDKNSLMQIISSLKKREFLLHNVHEEEPQFFTTRWVLSYLCGPLTREQIKTLMQNGERKSHEIISESVHDQIEQPIKTDFTAKPQLPATLRSYYAPVNNAQDDPGKILYHLYVVAKADVALFNNRYNVAQNVELTYILPCEHLRQGISWAESKLISSSPDLLTGEAIADADYCVLPREAGRLTTYENLDKQFETHVYQNYQQPLWQNDLLKLNSIPGESERDFRVRLMQAAHERRDLEVERIKRSYATKLNTLEKQLNAAQQTVAKESDQYQQKMLDTAISVGSTLFDVFLGGRKSRSGVSRSARSASKLSKEKRDIDRAKERMGIIESRIAELEKQLQEDVDNIAKKFDSIDVDLGQVNIRPKKSDILQRYFGLVWVPFLHGEDGNIISLNRSLGAASHPKDSDQS